jgi:threonyl-tRNA synthetase
MLVIGDKEVESGQVAVRTRKGDDLGTLPVDEVISRLSEEVAKRSI